MKGLLVVCVLLAGTLAGCADPYDHRPVSGCWDARDYYYEQAAKEIGHNNTKRAWYRSIAKEYEQAAWDGADCGGWKKNKLVAPEASA